MSSNYKYKLIIIKYKNEKEELIEEIHKDRLPQLIKQINKICIEKHYIKSSSLINFFMKHQIIPRKDFLFLALNPDEPDEDD